MPSLRVLFGHAVRRLRVEAGFSQESFADAIGVHRNYIGTVERGETNITLENISRISRGLKQPIWVLLKELESPGAGQAADVIPIPPRREAVPPSARPYAQPARVAERRLAVHEQLAGLLTELTELEGGEKPGKRGKRVGKKKK
jgi:transcriptional regulator with XRE-family HTH domain